MTTTALEVGATSVRYDEFLRAAAATIAPSLRVDAPHALLLLRGVGTLFEGGSKSAQADVAGALFTRARRGISGELSATAGANIYNDFDAIGSAAAGAFLYAARGSAGARAGAIAGGTSGSFAGEARDGERGFLRAELALWAVPVEPGAPMLELSLTPTRAGSVRYADVEGQLRWVRPRWELTTSAGTRSGAASLVEGSVRAWVDAAAAVRLTSRLSVVAAGGSYPPDLAQGIPGARYVSLSARVSSRARRRAAGYPGAVRPLPSASDPGTGDFVLLDAGDGRQTLRVRVPPGARVVEVMGDFTGWEPVALAPAAGVVTDRWEVTLPIAAGAHRLNIRVDGGDWTVPDGLPVQEDDFGGKVGVFTVR